ncbi:zinc-dependent metalloprotease family protein [Aquirhabdus sp.]|uniref:zinc-dependent metalloprotease family protein n=1 Tax=Aquirhabdus sp. TaxID=2824160 RepID=UPI00396C4AE7
MNKYAYTALFTACFATAVFATTTLTPKTNGTNGGNIPSSTQDIIFNMYDGNSVGSITLPKTSGNGVKVTINSQRTYNCVVDTSNTDFIEGGYIMRKGTSISFAFNSVLGIWSLATDSQFSPKINGDTIPTFTGTAAQYLISDTDWATSINLPQTANDNQIIMIRSDASKTSTINTANSLFPSTLTLNKGDTYYLQYFSDLNKWVTIGSPKRTINVVNGDTAQLNTALATLTAPKTEVKVADGAWVPNITLPQSAKDRDRIIVTSTASWQSTIDNANVNNTATFKLNKGDRYEFMYVADQANWELISSPKPVIQANEAANQLTKLKTPVTEVYADNTSWAASIALPTTAQNNDKVIVSSDADSSFYVTASGLSQKINTGDKVRFVYDGSTWKADTVQMDLLFVDSPALDAKIGATAAKLNMQNSLRVTNGALESSHVNAYFRQVGYLNYKIPGADMGAVLSAGRYDQTVQNEANRLGADAIHYQGLEPQTGGCGLGYVNGSPNKLNMISISRVDCPEQVISHELGHNLGLNHSFQRATDEAKREQDIAAGIKRAPLDFNYGFENALVGTLLSYKLTPIRIAYYSSPKVFEPKYGVRIGEEGKVDGARRVNANVVAISNFRTAVNGV